MNGLRNVVHSLAEREAAEVVLVVSADGLPIDQSGETTVDLDALAALVPSLVQSADRLAEGTRWDRLGSAVLEYGDRLLIVTVLRDGIHLVTVARPGSNIGELLFDLDRHRPAIAALL
jgi:predicted regulator of Ras-like GTPase activity (Roadblock/LC7/MglB family)